MKTVPVYEAKIRLSELLAAVELGEEVISVAILVPVRLNIAEAIRTCFVRCQVCPGL